MTNVYFRVFVDGVLLQTTYDRSLAEFNFFNNHYVSSKRLEEVTQHWGTGEPDTVVTLFEREAGVDNG